MSGKIEISRELAQDWLSYMCASDSPQLAIWANLLGSALAAPVVEQSAPVAVVLPERLPTEPYKTIDRGSANYKAGFNACIKQAEELSAASTRSRS